MTQKRMYDTHLITTELQRKWNFLTTFDSKFNTDKSALSG
jgi:hypothetical protein